MLIRRGGDPDLAAALRIARAILRLPQGGLARLSRTAPGSLCDHEGGKVTPEPATRSRLARALHLPWAVLEALALVARSVRALAAARREEASRPDLEAQEDEEVAAAEPAFEGLLRAALAVAREELRTLAAPPRWAARPRLPHAEDRAEAERLFALLVPFDAEQQSACVAELEELQNWALSELLSVRSEKLAAADAKRASELAGLALEVARLARLEPRFRAALEVHAWGYLGNARRVQGRLPEADEAFAHADRLGPAACGACPDLLDGTRLLDLEASLRLEQGRFAEALGLLDRALAAARDSSARGRLLIKKASALDLDGREEKALAVLREAALHVSPEEEPRQYFALRFNTLTALCHLGRHAEAAPGVAAVRALAARLGHALDLVRVRWLEGKVAAGLGHAEKAITALTEVRSAFEARDIAFDFALATLELAAIHLQDGDFARVRELAGEALALFLRQQVEHHALAALELFATAAREESATLALLWRLHAYLRRAEHARGLPFEA